MALLSINEEELDRFIAKRVREGVREELAKRGEITDQKMFSRKGSDWNMPTQRAMNLGLFKIKETTINHSNGTTSISKTPKVTGKGQQYFINKFLNGEVA